MVGAAPPDRICVAVGGSRSRHRYCGAQGMELCEVYLLRTSREGKLEVDVCGRFLGLIAKENDIVVSMAMDYHLKVLPTRSGLDDVSIVSSRASGSLHRHYIR